MPTHVPAPALISVGVDWLTATNPREVDPRLFARFGRWLLDQQPDVGGQLRADRRLGYDGHAANHVYYGERHDGAMLQLAGADAAEWWSVPVALGAHITRIDLQVTVDLGRDWKWLSWRHWREIARYRPPRGRPVEPEVRLHPTKGDTLYVGDRASEQHARCYDKAREQPEDYPPGSWRYEVEYKGDAAPVIAARLVEAVPYLPRLAATIHAYFNSVGARPLWHPSAAPLELKLPRSRSDDAKALRWLERQVRPTVQRLLAGGHYADLLRALEIEPGDGVS